MSKYYKAEDVIRAIAEQLCWEARTEYGDKFTTEDWLEEAEGYVSGLPIIDIVHCKDCKHNETSDCAMWYEDSEYRIQYSWNNPNDYCSYGERIDNE